MSTRPPLKTKRIGKNADDIFVPHVDDGGADRPKKRGRRPSHTEHWTKVTVVLFDRQIVNLDRLAVDIRGKSGKMLNRAEIIRALIDGLLDSGMDITGSASEADLRARVARRLGSPYR